MVLKLSLVAVLIILTAFFVAAEFALVKLRSSRVEQMVSEGFKNAAAVKRVTSHLDDYLSACQLGITITALGLGWLGEPTVEELLHPLFHALHMSDSVSTLLSFIIAFVAVTYLHVVLGELAPKSIAIQQAERISQFTAPPLIWFHKAMYPFIWVLNGSARLFIRALGFRSMSEHEEAHSEEEIRVILSESYESGKINKTEYGYVNRIFRFDDLLAREIMVPRTDMICLYADKTLEENMEIIKREQYTRFPVALGSKDNLVGFMNTKQFFLAYADNPKHEFKKLLHPIMTVPEAMPIKHLLRKMQTESVHLAALLDEYGGTSGIITIEDILEEIVGEIRDEFDKDEQKEIQVDKTNRYVVDGKVLIRTINKMLGTDLSSEDVDTIGGWMWSNNPDIVVGDQIQIDGYTFTVMEQENNRIRKIEIVKRSEMAEVR
ncbi:hemolysin family protein [Paenibacillus kobensis]|uniref:hemolysin family protein n=1 Tax=Paenibacillus kobensis TaxID=59841 RepID=UPI000FDB76C2|nr:hemolysin family protein [Paenibacillus kobensis]